jgi:hypothetical protein
VHRNSLAFAFTLSVAIAIPELAHASPEQDALLFLDSRVLPKKASACSARIPGYPARFEPAFRTWLARNKAHLASGEAFLRADAERTKVPFEPDVEAVAVDISQRWTARPAHAARQLRGLADPVEGVGGRLNGRSSFASQHGTTTPPSREAITPESSTSSTTTRSPAWFRVRIETTSRARKAASTATSICTTATPGASSRRDCSMSSASDGPVSVLRPMTASEYAEWVEQSITGYAADKVASGQWTPEESLELTRKEIGGLLPLGLETPGNHSSPSSTPELLPWECSGTP